MKNFGKVTAAATILLVALSGCGSNDSVESKSSTSSEPSHPADAVQLKKGYKSSETSEMFPDGVKITATDKEPEAFKKVRDLTHTSAYKDAHFIAVETPKPLSQKLATVSLHGDKESMETYQYENAQDWFVGISSDFESARTGLEGDLPEADKKFLQDIADHGLTETKDGKTVTYLMSKEKASTEIWAPSPSSSSSATSSASEDSEDEPDDAPSTNPSAGWYTEAKFWPADPEGYMHSSEDLYKDDSTHVELKK